jgi:tripartite-type tricarboxylate transporter receptor subunit TctC
MAGVPDALPTPQETTMITRRRLAAALALAGAGPVFGQGARGYPDRPVKMLIPFPAGQGADIIGRLVAEALSKTWGQNVVVDNRGGGGGVPGMVQGMQAPPDGYTLVLGGSQSVTVNPALYPKLPYDPLRDFQPVCGLYAGPLVWVVHPGSGITSLTQLVERARREPGKLSYASAGTGTSQHMTSELFKHLAKIDMAHVPYRGSGPAMVDLLSGQVGIMLDGLASALPHIRAGRIQALAVTTAQRAPQIPNVPTIAESGFPGFSSLAWAGLFFQRAVPRDIVDKVSTDVRAFLKDPATAEKLLDRGVIPDPLGPDEAAAFMRTDMAQWARIAAIANVKVE